MNAVTPVGDVTPRGVRARDVDRFARRARGRDPEVMDRIAEELGADPCLTVGDVLAAFARHGVPTTTEEAHDVLDRFDEIRCEPTWRLDTDHTFQRADARRDGWTGPLWRHAAHLRERRAARSGGA